MKEEMPMTEENAGGEENSAQNAESQGDEGVLMEEAIAGTDESASTEADGAADEYAMMETDASNAESVDQEAVTGSDDSPVVSVDTAEEELTALATRASMAETDDTAAGTDEDESAIDTGQLKKITEAILLAAGRPMNLDQLLSMFSQEERPDRGDMRKALAELEGDFSDRGIELVQVASGYRIQIRQEMQLWVSNLWEEKPVRYSRALLETLALIAYRQPITRGEIEEVRGVSVSSSIMKTLQEREWVRVVGHRDVPGHPAMYGTTKQFLDYFSLKSLEEMPTLAELRDLSTIGTELELDLGAVAESQLPPANDEDKVELSGPEEMVPAEQPVEESNTTTLH